MVKLTNDQNIKNLKKRKILRRFIILFGILTIVLAVLSLTVKLGFGYSLVAFIIMTILTKAKFMPTSYYVFDRIFKKFIQNVSNYDPI